MAYIKPDRFPCPFCEYIAERVPSAKLYENDLSVAFMAVNRRSKGAVLVSPRRHIEQISHLSDNEAISIFELITKSIKSLSRTYAPEGFHLFCNAGKKAGQSVCHVHFQIQTRFKNVEYLFIPAMDLQWIPVDELRENVIEIKQSAIGINDKDIHVDVLTEQTLLGNLKTHTSYKKINLLHDNIVLEMTDNFYVLIPTKMRTRGSLIIIPKNDSYDNITKLDSMKLEELVLLIKKYCIAIEKTYDPIGLSVWSEIGTIADQFYKHFIYEITPYHENEVYKYKSRLDLPDCDLNTRIEIKEELDKYLK